MKKIKYLTTSLLLSLFVLAGCKNNDKKDNNNEIPDGELTYEQFKEIFDKREIKNFNHCEHEYFYGYIDILRDRDDDGKPTFELESLDYIYNEQYDCYLWTGEDGYIESSLNGEEEGYILDDASLASLLTPPECITGIRYYKEKDSYKIVMTGVEDKSHIVYSANYCDYAITAIQTYNKYFYQTEFIKTVDDLLDCRVHDNKILYEEHMEWSIKELS